MKKSSIGIIIVALVIGGVFATMATKISNPRSFQTVGKVEKKSEVVYTPTFTATAEAEYATPTSESVATPATATPVSESITLISEVSQESQETSVTPEEANVSIDTTPTVTVYVVAKGDMLSCLFPKNWKEIAEQNGITNPDLIYPGQKLNLLPGTEVHGGCVAQHKQSVGYCNIGADPVNPNRELSALEREHSLESDTLVHMGTGSGKEVKCVLKKNEIVVIDDTNEAKWVRICGNPIFNKIIVAAVKPTQPATEISAVPEEKVVVRPKKKSGLIILKTFEGATSSEMSSGVLRDSYGNVVHDDFGNPVKTETK